MKNKYVRVDFMAPESIVMNFDTAIASSCMSRSDALRQLMLKEIARIEQEKRELKKELKSE